MLERQEKTNDAERRLVYAGRRNTIFLSALMMLAIMLALCGTNTVQASTKNSTKIGNAWYTVLSEKNATAQYEKPANKTLSSVSIPATVKMGNKTYKVTSVANGALKGYTNVKKLSIGKNVTKIGKNAYYGCKNLQTVTIKATKLIKNNVGSNAFKGLSSNAVVTVPAGKLKTYEDILKSKGLVGENQKVKESAKNSSFSYPDSTSSYFEKEFCRFSIQSEDGTSTSGYSAGDTIPLYTEFGFTPKVYGHWEKDDRKLVNGYTQCRRCEKYFTDYMLAFHNEMELSFQGGCGTSCFIGLDKKQPTTWAFIPDKNACKVVLTYTFPQGLSYKDGSLKVTGKVSKKEYTDSCKASFSGNQLVVTIDDIKSEPFYKAFKYEEYQKNLYYKPSDEDDDFRQPFVIRFSAEVDSTVGAAGVISAAMSYTHKDSSSTENYNISVRTASMQLSNTDASGNSLSGAEFDLYQKKTRYPSGSNMGTSDWELFKSGVHAGDTITGMGTGTDAFDNQYKLVQTKAPAGYEKAYNTEFELFISENGTVTAESEEGDALEVVNGVVQVNVLNEEKISGSENTVVSNNTSAADVPQTVTDTPVTNNTPAQSGKKGINVKAIYFQDGVRESSLTFHEVVDASETMMDKKDISDRAYFFKGYRLERITLNGVEVDSLPEKVEDKSEICFYYVSE